MMLRALIIDDEQRASDMLQLLIERHAPQITRVWVCNDARQAAAAIHEHQPELLFLDIRMPHLDGFQVLNSVVRKPFKVIFTTAFNEYAIQAIRFSAFDYLLKPIDVQELMDAIQRFISAKEEINHQPAQLKNALANLETQDPAQFKLALPSREGIFFLSPPEIIRCEAMGSYTRFYSSNKRTYLTSKSIGEYEDILAPHGFLRSHKSHLVNRLWVAYLDHDGFLILKDESRVEVSRRRKEEVLRGIKN